jgi:hypothetical protein
MLSDASRLFRYLPSLRLWRSEASRPENRKKGPLALLPGGLRTLRKSWELW